MSFMEWVENVYDPADVKARFMDQWSGNPISELLKREQGQEFAIYIKSI